MGAEGAPSVRYSALMPRNHFVTLGRSGLRASPLCPGTPRVAGGEPSLAAVLDHQGHHVRVTAIIAAGGRGQRFGSARPKQLLTVDGRPILERSVTLFVLHPDIDDIVVALPAVLPLMYFMMKRLAK